MKVAGGGSEFGGDGGQLPATGFRRAFKADEQVRGGSGSGASGGREEFAECFAAEFFGGGVIEHIENDRGRGGGIEFFECGAELVRRCEGCREQCAGGGLWTELKGDLRDRPELSASTDQQAAEIVAGDIFDDATAGVKAAGMAIESFDTDDVVTKSAAAVLPRAGSVRANELADRLLVGERIDGELVAMGGKHRGQLCGGDFGANSDGHVVDGVVDDQAGNGRVWGGRMHWEFGGNGWGDCVLASARKKTSARCAEQTLLTPLVQNN